MMNDLGHRFDDSKAMRRRKISHHTASVVHIGHMKKVKAAPVVPRRLQSEQQLQHHKVASLTHSVIHPAAVVVILGCLN